jgi:hypothetical protein
MERKEDEKEEVEDEVEAEAAAELGVGVGVSLVTVDVTLSEDRFGRISDFARRSGWFSPVRAGMCFECEAAVSNDEGSDNAGVCVGEEKCDWGFRETEPAAAAG